MYDMQIAGLCYGKPEAAALFFVIPTLLLGRLVSSLHVFHIIFA